VEVSCEHGNKLSGSIKRWEVLEWLHNWRLLKRAQLHNDDGDDDDDDDDDECDS
jgi:hypothetical protein